MNKSAYFFRKGWSIALYTIWSFCLWGRRLPPGEGEKFRFQHRFQKRIAPRMINVLRAGFGEGTPQQVSDRRHKKRGSGFLWHRSILALSTFACFIRLHSNPVFVNVHEWLRLLQLAVQKRSSKVTLRNQELLCFRQHSKRNYTLILYLLPCKAAWSRIRFTQPIVTIKEAKPWQ